MEQNYTRFKKFKELDIFIQNSLDKYFYVEPWKKLYERTGKLHRDIISDKSTIPDLIIYNKTFNKSDCFIGSKEKSYIKFPRYRFILRPKYKKEYYPSCTYGQDEVYFYNKHKVSENNKNLFSYSNNNYKNAQDLNEDETKTFLKQNIDSKMDNNLINEQDFKTNENKNHFHNLKSLEDEEEEEDPEWANDNVEDYSNTKIEFKAIPKSVEEKMNEELGLISDNINNINLNNLEKNNIDVDNFFTNYNLNNLEISPKNNINDNFLKEIKDFMNSKQNEDNEIKKQTNIENNKDYNNDNLNEISNDIKSDEENINKHFNIFDTDNKFNDIFLGEHKSNYKNNQKDNNNTQENNNNRENSRFFNNNININENIENLKEINKINEINEAKIKNMLMIQQQKQQQQQKTNLHLQYLQLMQMKNNQLKQNTPNNIIQQPSSFNYINNPPYLNNNISILNNPNLLANNNPFGNNMSYINNFNQQTNNTNFLNSINNPNYFPSNYNIQGVNMANINMQNSNSFNNLNNYRLNLNKCNVNSINDKDIYVNSINNMIYRNNNIKFNPNNLINNIGLYNKNIENNSNFIQLNKISQNNISPVNQNNNNIFPQTIWKNIQDNKNNANVYKTYNSDNNINNNIVDNINKSNSLKYNDNYKKINEQKNTQKALEEKDINNVDNPNKYVNPADYLENPSLILKKNLTKKNWLVLNKDNSIIHNFNSEELLKFLEDKIKNDISLEEFTINDYDTDVVFPAKVIFENLKTFYSN